MLEKWRKISFPICNPVSTRTNTTLISQFAYACKPREKSKRSYEFLTSKIIINQEFTFSNSKNIFSMKNRIFIFLYIYLVFQNFRLIGAEDGNHGWLKIELKKELNGTSWYYTWIKMSSGKEELVERNRNRSHFAAMKRMKLGKKIIWIILRFV